MTSSRPCAPDCLGIPVRYDAAFTGISDSRGLWRFKKIVVGPVFMCFAEREQQAILLHEAGHCKLRHLEKRIAKLWLLFVNWKRLQTVCREQEFEADRFVAGCGYGPDLARAFSRLAETESPLHPNQSERIKRLAAWPLSVIRS